MWYILICRLCSRWDTHWDTLWDTLRLIFLFLGYSEFHITLRSSGWYAHLPAGCRVCERETVKSNLGQTPSKKRLRANWKESELITCQTAAVSVVNCANDSDNTPKALAVIYLQSKQTTPATMGDGRWAIGDRQWAIQRARIWGQGWASRISNDLWSWKRSFGTYSAHWDRGQPLPHDAPSNWTLNCWQFNYHEIAIAMQVDEPRVRWNSSALRIRNVQSTRHSMIPNRIK